MVKGILPKPLTRVSGLGNSEKRFSNGILIVGRDGVHAEKKRMNKNEGDKVEGKGRGGVEFIERISWD